MSSVFVSSLSSSPNSSLSKAKHKIAICQLTCKENKNENFNICKKLITEAKSQGAEIVFLPEACDYIEQSTKASIEKGETLDGEFIENYKKLASDLQIWISIGSFHRKIENYDQTKIYNTNILVSNEGEIKSIYDKVHLFEVNLKNGDVITSLKESDYTQAGSEFFMPIETPFGTLGNCICYDLRFPQMSAILRKFGAQILSYPSVFTVPTGQAHWEILLRARAIENQCYVVASAQVGEHNQKRSSYGHSMVVDPWGKVLVDLKNESPCVKIVEIDLDYLKQVRNSMPISNSIRSDLYLQYPIVKKKIDRPFYNFSEKIKLDNKSVFLETQYCIGVVNIKPIVPGHVMIIPKEIRHRVEDMTSEEAIDLFHTAKYVAAELERHFNATSLNFGIQDGPDSGQSVKRYKYTSFSQPILKRLNNTRVDLAVIVENRLFFKTLL
ncbi:unnamed protein product [Brachionus calyciflorus]|uniref:Uncharacterized protein n=1 Tax=Brachionus calyciflorus TaxID=104777 RepID=A0A814GXQ9_9BILA|nr:unnamed protein product [Brachionus calyciflorus]